ncbi:ABC transporter ATP-binding protein [Rhodococcus rhodochrous]|uniref:ABC transporter ATP-binding protein n=1 Tax=Rhodococcus rhodochrous TaxID=1829 RepID=A0AAW4XPD6_RHORH|nr:ABC transporter ATP-binding protein [Rhodococcus rhodochrous]MCD2114654.1 ABC transporter ATP-binding protein [Rhodococcus rhodochrous]
MTADTQIIQKDVNAMTTAPAANNPLAEPKVSFTNVRQVFALPKQSKKDSAAASTVVALDNVNLEIPDGQFVALVGASGCGKTTLMNMIAGLVTPTTGTVKVSGETPRLPNLDIGYMFARDALLPWRSARRSVELPLEVRGWDRQRRRERADAMLDLVGLADKHTQYRNQLSQGMRQRVALARTLASDPSILLMDEPFAALDARTKLTLEGEFLRIWEDGGDSRKTVVFVTHDLEEAVLLADRVVIMLPRPGRIAKDIIVDLPRPRADHLGEVRYTEKFREITQGLFDSLEGAIAANDSNGMAAR